MTMLKELNYDDLEFDGGSSQQFATVVFDRSEDEDKSHITVIRDSNVHQFNGHNKYNPSSRRHSSCVYATEEYEGGKTVKFCTIQHKGNRLIEVHSVSDEELEYLFHTAH